MIFTSSEVDSGDESSSCRPLNVIDGTQLAHSNWMKRVSPAPEAADWNLLAYQHNQNIYFITIKPVEPNQELMVGAITK